MDQDLRYELKAAVNGRYLPNVRNWLRLHPEGFRTAYPSRRVNSLYFDTPELDAFNENLMGVSQRRKLRLRWYSNLDSGAPQIVSPTLELKFKDNLVGGKKRISLPLTLDLTQPCPALVQQVRQAVPSAWQDLLSMVSQPTLLNSYQRDYFVTPDNAIRATLDYQQVAYDQRLGRVPNVKRPLPLENLLVIEIKSDLTQEERLEEIMAYFPVPRSRNSKYANGVLAAL
ncbi:MAG: polyphosphate polymerase domain-containing protein [Chloroflexota bacterium]